MTPVVRPVSPFEAAAQRLLQASDQYMAGLYPPGSNHLESAAALAAPHVRFFGIYFEERLVGCGALKRMQDDGLYGEVKRVYVEPALRGRGLARLLMQHLEKQALDSGLAVLRLESGVRQPEALGLYRDLGYRQREPFGAYRPDPLSLFMEKRLGAD